MTFRKEDHQALQPMYHFRIKKAQADEWDRITVGQWYDSQNLSPVARTLLEICTVGILAMPTVEVSLLCLLQNVAVCGVTAELLAESEGGAQTKRFVGGTSLDADMVVFACGIPPGRGCVRICPIICAAAFCACGLMVIPGCPNPGGLPFDPGAVP